MINGCTTIPSMNKPYPPKPLKTTVFAQERVLEDPIMQLKYASSASYIKAVFLDRIGLEYLGEFLEDASFTIDENIIKPLDVFRTFRIGGYTVRITFRPSDEESLGQFIGLDFRF